MSAQELESSENSDSESDNSSSLDSKESVPNDNDTANGEIDGDEVDEDVIEYDDVKLDASVVPVTLDELMDDDTELWLLRIPKHDILLNGIVGKSMTVDDSTNKTGRTNTKIGTFRGSYHFRDHGQAGAQHTRAAFVFNNSDSTNPPSLQVAKPFARAVTVTFEAALTKFNDTPQQPRTYPSSPSNLKLQFRTIGSKKGRRSYVSEDLRKRKKHKLSRVVQ